MKGGQFSALSGFENCRGTTELAQVALHNPSRMSALITFLSDLTMQSGRGMDSFGSDEAQPANAVRPPSDAFINVSR